MKKHAGGRKRMITLEKDGYVSLVAKRNKNPTPRQIAADLEIASSTHNSARTILLRLNQVCLYAWKPVRFISLQPRYRRERLRWCKEYIGWGHQQ